MIDGGDAHTVHELERYQRALPVRLIATERSQFVVCKRDDTLGAIRERIAHDAFDHLPVVDEKERIVGVLDIRALGSMSHDARVRDCCIPIGEELLIGAEVSVLEFLEDADRRPFRFLVTRDGISGLVSLSDIQRLPVRAALFAIITQFEMAATRLIAEYFPQEGWMVSLSPGRREKIEDELRKATGDQNQVAPLLYTQIADKTDLLALIARARGNEESKSALARKFDRIEKLRNALAHSNTLGVTRDDACAVVATVRDIKHWIDWIQVSIKEIGSNTKEIGSDAR
jgi:hypothetical protein